MNLQLGPDEYKKLVELTYLGEWLVNSHHDPEHQDETAESVFQKVLAAAPVRGIGQDVETKDFFVKDEWAAKLYEDYIADYDDHVFWDELTERLAQRDLAKLRGASADSIDREEDLTELRPLEEKYHFELEEHGIDRLNIDPDF
jgi:hypothetical protein